jgi:hypothetical protein
MKCQSCDKDKSIWEFIGPVRLKTVGAGNKIYSRKTHCCEDCFETFAEHDADVIAFMERKNIPVSEIVYV